MSLDGVTYTLAKFFEEGSGPWKYILDEKSQKLAQLEEGAQPSSQSFSEMVIDP